MAEITEKQIYEAFGLGEEAQELAEPAAEASEPANTGAQAQELAEPAQETQPGEGIKTEPTVEDADPKEPEDPAEDGTEPEKSPQTIEQRRANAARRRQQEQQAAVNQAVEAALQKEREKQQADTEAFFQKAGLKNTITGEPITNMDQFNAWHQQFGEAKLQRELQSGKLTPEGLATAIGNHPLVKQAQQLIEKDTAAKKAAEEAAARTKIEAEIAEIHKIDESITSLDDLMKAPYWPELYAKTQRGYSIQDAHYLLNKDRLEKAKLDAAKQQTLNNTRSKNHMTATAAARGGGSVSVPASELAVFRQFMPDATDAEIQAYYNKYKKG